MSLLAAVTDSTSIIGLSKGGVFNLLASLYDPLYVPRAVRREIIDRGRGRAGSTELQQALGQWITEVVPTAASRRPYRGLRSVADRQVLAVAHDPSYAIDHMLTDDDGLVGRVVRAELVCLRTPDVVVLLKRQGLIPEVRAVLDQMLQEGFGIDTALYEKALRVAAE
jgi:predicted nucleic acid-binding protein